MGEPARIHELPARHGGGSAVETAYLDLLRDILETGERQDDRTGVGTLSVFGRQMRCDLSEGFPLLTTKKVHFKSIAIELLWFLRGETKVRRCRHRLNFHSKACG